MSLNVPSSIKESKYNDPHIMNKDDISNIKGIKISKEKLKSIDELCLKAEIGSKKTFSDVSDLNSIKAALITGKKDVSQVMFTSYTIEDVRESIKFLKSFCNYCASNNVEPCEEITTKTVNLLKQLADYLEGDIGLEEKIVIKKLVKRIKENVDTLLLEHLNRAQQKDHAVAIDKAQTILKKFIS